MNLQHSEIEPDFNDFCEDYKQSAPMGFQSMRGKEAILENKYI